MDYLFYGIFQVIVLEDNKYNMCFAIVAMKVG